MPNWTFLARVCQGTTHLVWSRSGFYNPQQENKLLPSRTSRFPLRNCPSAKSWAGEQAENRLQECYLRLPACQPRPWCGCLSWAITIYRKICFKYSTLKKQSWNWLFFGGSHLLTVQLFKWNKFHCTLSVQETFVCSPGGRLCRLWQYFMCMSTCWHLGSWKSIFLLASQKQSQQA